jgi:hypothetical protein
MKQGADARRADRFSSNKTGLSLIIVVHIPPQLCAQPKAPRKTGALPNFNRSEPQAATLVGLTSRSLLELAIGIDRDFIASGISRTRSTCRSPFPRLAPLTLT